jgi:uncharacterized DUF497 family protein
MQFEWDDRKARENLGKHGVAFDAAKDLDWTKSVTVEDTRVDYKERRFILYAPLGDRLHVLVFTRRVDRIRVISLRKANDREIEEYERIQAASPPQS